MGYSFPAIFMAGGISLVIAWVIISHFTQFGVAGHDCRERPPWRSPEASRTFPAERHGGHSLHAWFPWIVYNILLVASFATLLVVSKDSVGAANRQMMETDWGDTFPPIMQPLKLPLWLLETHAGAMFSYPDGGSDGGSTFSLLCVIAGVAALVRRRQWLLLGLLLAPLGLNFIAAALHRYPYGGQFRLAIFLAPAFCTLIALGLTAVLAWIEDWRRRNFSMGTMRNGGPTPNLRRTGSGPPGNWNVCTIVLALLVLLGARSWFLAVMHPYKSATSQRSREFARWFWFELAHNSELVSCESDLQTDLSPDKRNWGRSSLYFCNLRIYSPRHARGEKPHLDRVSVDWPLRCVLYRSPTEEQGSPSRGTWCPDPQARQRWLKRMQAEYDLVAYDAFSFADDNPYPFVTHDKSDRRQGSDDYVEVFKFVPKSGSGAAVESGDSTSSQFRRLVELKKTSIAYRTVLAAHGWP